MLDLEATIQILKAGDVYVLAATFLWWAWRADRRFVAIETTLTHLVRKG